MIEDRLALAADANRAPSVHNIQPARFRFVDARTIQVLEEPSRRLFVGDPEGKDNLKSLGAALEGLSLALSVRELGAEVKPGAGDVRAQVEIVTGAAPDPLAAFVETRATYRGVFAPREDGDRVALERVAARCPDLTLIQAPEAIAEMARFFDQVSMEVLRDRPYRAELLHWMRLSKRHPDYARDGLNAEHMAMSPFEAAGARAVLSDKGFPLFDALGLAGPLASEAGKVKSAAALALFHRPEDEPHVESGRRFYRVWLEIEREGLALCPMSVLADTPHAAARLLCDAGLERRKLVTVFRIGRRPANARLAPRARLPAAELIV